MLQKREAETSETDAANGRLTRLTRYTTVPSEFLSLPFLSAELNFLELNLILTVKFIEQKSLNRSLFTYASKFY